MEENMQILLSRILVGGAGESTFCPGFIKIYAKDNQEKLLNRFIDVYQFQCSEFMESVKGFQMKEGDWVFDDYPKGVSSRECLILDDGILVNLGVITMLIYGRDVLSFWNFSFSCVEDTIEQLSKEFGVLLYEGVITLFDETSSYVSDEGTVSSYVIGNVSDYGFTVNRVLETMCTRNLTNLHLDKFLKFCDCKEAGRYKQQILAVLSSWYNAVTDPDDDYGAYYLEENYDADLEKLDNWISRYFLEREYENASTSALLTEACAEMCNCHRKQTT